MAAAMPVIESPPAVRRLIDLVQQPRPAGARPLDAGLCDQSSVHELGQVLTDGVVVELEVRGELGDTNRTIRVGDVLVDGVAGRIAECPGLLLQCLHRSPLGRILVLTSTSDLYRTLEV